MANVHGLADNRNKQNRNRNENRNRKGKRLSCNLGDRNRRISCSGLLMGNLRTLVRNPSYESKDLTGQGTDLLGTAGQIELMLMRQGENASLELAAALRRHSTWW